MMQLLIDVHLCSSCSFDEMKKENKIGHFFSFHQKYKQSRGLHQLIVLSLAVANDDLLIDTSSLFLRVLEFCWGSNLISITLCLFIFYLEKSLNYLIFFINY